MLNKVTRYVFFPCGMWKAYIFSFQYWLAGNPEILNLTDPLVFLSLPSSMISTGGVLLIYIPEEHRLYHGPCFRIPAMLAENISRILLAFYMDELDDLGSDCFSDSVIGQSIMSLIETGVWECGACDNRLIISKHVGWARHIESKVSQCCP